MVQANWFVQWRRVCFDYEISFRSEKAINSALTRYETLARFGANH
ncbi:MAG: hypothetical protein RL186_1274 [Pseudomonadota bacterium]